MKNKKVNVDGLKVKAVGPMQRSGKKKPVLFLTCADKPPKGSKQLMIQVSREEMHALGAVLKRPPLMAGTHAIHLKSLAQTICRQWLFGKY
ncbi:MAG TPA: hypothetical protein VH413_16365 [Verrucomicrobiae bacterium]|jgi:hypothetical protein|nr:hypothetical protein [Verrucomicrobiae bacterium]